MAVLTERALAQGYIDAVLAATDEGDAEDAAEPYLAMT
jgi:coenzyme F420-reducing hydrogenase beta subunit